MGQCLTADVLVVPLAHSLTLGLKDFCLVNITNSDLIVYGQRNVLLFSKVQTNTQVLWPTGVKNNQLANASATWKKRRVCRFQSKANPCYLCWSARLPCLWGLAAKPSSSPSSMWSYPSFETVRERTNRRERKAIIRALRKYYAGSFKRGLLGSGQRWKRVTVWLERWDRQTETETIISSNTLQSPLTFNDLSLMIIGLGPRIDLIFLL